MGSLRRHDETFDLIFDVLNLEFHETSLKLFPLSSINQLMHVLMLLPKRFSETLKVLSHNYPLMRRKVSGWGMKTNEIKQWATECNQNQEMGFDLTHLPPSRTRLKQVSHKFHNTTPSF